MTERTNRTLAFLTFLVAALVIYYVTARPPEIFPDEWPEPEMGPIFRPHFIFTFLTLGLSGLIGIWFTPTRRRRGVIVVAVVATLLFQATRDYQGFEWCAGLIAVACLAASVLISFWPGRARHENGESLSPGSRE